MAPVGYTRLIFDPIKKATIKICQAIRKLLKFIAQWVICCCQPAWVKDMRKQVIFVVTKVQQMNKKLPFRSGEEQLCRFKANNPCILWECLSFKCLSSPSKNTRMGSLCHFCAARNRGCRKRLPGKTCFKFSFLFLGIHFFICKTKQFFCLFVCFLLFYDLSRSGHLFSMFVTCEPRGPNVVKSHSVFC